jgi:hypothetical protein
VLRTEWVGAQKDYDRIDVGRRHITNDLKPIRSNGDFQAALAEVERLWGAKSGTPEGDRLEIVATR